ncbi:hypothetical protein LLS47_12290 [Rouxiella badensis]|jgi:hypothetical protein|uniref:capsid staple protein n=1 Tax=Rouxiella badensis TaxID=1646377 RepID=UPI001D13714A|nr:hypothetical protein [Rouxiella badensis]MCC3733707.1 hypothetical protein [Rouxiella badensis]MCC3759640.1 hypothetical protein [Rouxiella badensis]
MKQPQMVNLKQGTDSFETEDGKTVQRDDYPWGLRVTLNNDVMQKLGIPLPKVGSEMMLIGKVKVLSTSTRQDGEETNNNCDLQITDIGLADDTAAPQKSAADTLYGSAE